MTSADSLSATTRRLAELLGDAVELDAPLGPLTTYRVGGAAAAVVRPRDLGSLRVVGEVLRDRPAPLLVLGRGSNVLVSDAGFAGVVLMVTDIDGDVDHLEVEPLGAAPADDGPTAADRVVHARAGIALPVLARRTAAMGLTGLEWMVGVPGSVGGAVRMNAGGHGSDVAESLVDATIHDLTTGSDTVRPASTLGLRFRGSDIAATDVVLSARFRLAVGDRERSESLISDIVRWRRENQPGGQNAGSVFVNPVPGEVAAAQLIDGLGLRGFRIGTAEVSVKHANFIQADEDGRADDVRAVMEAVRARVAEKCGVLLRSEVRLVGFGDDESAAGER